MMDKQERIQAAAEIMAKGILRLLKSSSDPSELNREMEKPGYGENENTPKAQTG